MRVGDGPKMEVCSTNAVREARKSPRPAFPAQSSLIRTGRASPSLQLDRICVVTSDAAAYYSLVSRLRSAELPFSSALPSATPGCELVLTTSKESSGLGANAMTLEELDADPGIFKGQIVSRLEGGTDVLLVGVDPGKRIGVAVFYGRVRLAFLTFASTDEVCKRVAAFAARVPSSQVLVRVGGGNRTVASEIVDSVMVGVPVATLEIVNESGTSAGSPRMRGVQRDQVAAAKIAFRKGEVVKSGGTRSPSRALR